LLVVIFRPETKKAADHEEFPIPPPLLHAYSVLLFNTNVQQREISMEEFEFSSTLMIGRAMAQAISRRPPTAEAPVRSRVSPRGICGGQSGNGTGFFSPSTSVFPCQFHSTGAPLQVKTKKTDRNHRVAQ
jgi:hypothetical protein